MVVGLGEHEMPRLIWTMLSGTLPDRWNVSCLLGILTGSSVLLQHRPGRLKMTRMAFVAGALASLAFGFQPAAADYYGAPWCAVVAMGDGDMQWSCEYRSIEECRPNVLAGNRGWCNPNPYFVASRPSEHRRYTKRHARSQ
jgi:hypothetical protein